MAEVVVKITVEDDPRTVLHTNIKLVRADSPEEAYEKAQELGASEEQSYENPDGKLVTFQFLGLHDLNVIHDKLEHGAEIIYLEDIGLGEPAIQKWLTPKEALGVFAPIIPSSGPNYSSREVIDKVRQMMADSKL